MLFGQSWIAETDERIAPSVLGRHPTGQILLDPHLDV